MSGFGSVTNGSDVVLTSVNAASITSTSVLSGTIAKFTTVTGSTVTGSTAIFTTVTGSTVTGSTAIFGTVAGSLSGNGANVTNLTASNITNFTTDVRAQFTAGTNITITNGSIAGNTSAATLAVRTLTASAAILSTDCVILGSGSSPINVFLPSASLNTGKVFYISNVISSNNYVVVSSSQGNVNGTGSLSLSSRASAGSAVGFISDGSNWWKITS